MRVSGQLALCGILVVSLAEAHAAPVGARVAVAAGELQARGARAASHLTGRQRVMVRAGLVVTGVTSLIAGGIEATRGNGVTAGPLVGVGLGTLRAGLARRGALPRALGRLAVEAPVLALGGLGVGAGLEAIDPSGSDIAKGAGVTLAGAYAVGALGAGFEESHAKRMAAAEAATPPARATSGTP